MKTFIEILRLNRGYSYQIFKLARVSIKRQYADTFMGSWWSIFQPALRILIYYFVFDSGLRVSRSVNDFPYLFWLIAGFVPWFFIQDTLYSGTSCIVNNRHLVSKVYFPIPTIPAFTVLANLFIHLIMVSLMLILFIVSGYMPDIYWLQLPFYIILMYIFCYFLSLFNSILAALRRDILQLIRKSTFAFLWLSGIFYNIDSISHGVIRTVLKWNPILYFINGFRYCLIYKVWFWDRPQEMFRFIVVFIVVFVLSLNLYKKNKLHIADYL